MPQPPSPGSSKPPFPVSEHEAHTTLPSASSSQTPHRSPQGLFVGRATELAALQTALANSLANHGQLVMLSGEPGIGKTRLAQEFVATAQQQGVMPLWGRCWEGEGAPAFWPWVQIIRALVQQSTAETLVTEMGSGAATVAQVVPDIRERLPHLPAVAWLDSEHVRFHFFDSLTLWLKRVTVRRPLLLILDDLHWADTPSLLLLQFLARELAEARLMVLGIYRDTEVAKTTSLADALSSLSRESQRLPLTGLTAAEVTHLVSGMGLVPQETLVTKLHQETSGNPFFLSEALQLLAREDNPRLAPFPISQGVRDTIRRRLAQLSLACVQLLSLAAVIGREFSVDLITDSYQPPLEGSQTLSLVQEALTARLLSTVPDNPTIYRFVHALVRETLYEDLPLPERVRFHLQVGEAMERQYAAYLRPHLTALADHFFKAAVGDTRAKALHYAIQAGERANALFAYEEAVTFYERALQLLPLQPEAEEQRCELLLALGSTQAKTGENKKARATFLQAAGLARHLPQHSTGENAATFLTRAALGVAGRGDVATRFDQPMVSLLEDALATFSPVDSALRVRLLARLAMALYFSPFSARRNELSREAVAMARRLGDSTTLAYALNARHMALIGPDSVTERLALAEEVIQLADPSEKKEIAAAGHFWRLMDMLELGNIVEVDHEMRRYGELAEEIRQPFYFWQTTVLRAMQALLEGRFAEAEQLAHEGFTLGQRTHTPNAALLFAVQISSLRREQGRLQELEGALKAVCDQYPSIPSLRTGLALVYCELGQMNNARQEFAQLASEEFAQLTRDQGWLCGMSHLAQVAAFLQDTQHAGTLYTQLLPYAHRIIVVGSATDCYGPVSRYLGILATILGRWNDAEQHFADAITKSEILRARPQVAHAQYEYACMFFSRKEQGDQVRSQALLNQALVIARELGMIRLQTKIASLTTKVREEEKQQSKVKSQKYGEARDRRLEASISPPSSPTSPASSLKKSDAECPNFLRRDGDYWTIAYEGVVVHIQDAKGLYHLVTLLREPRRDFHVFDLLAMTDHPVRTTSAKGLPQEPLLTHGTSIQLRNDNTVPDRQAIASYRQRLTELRDALPEAEENADLQHLSNIRAEMDFITTELASQYGLGANLRTRNANVEKARKTITNRFRTVLIKLKSVHPALWRHLVASLKTGTFCSYNPERPMTWQL